MVDYLNMVPEVDEANNIFTQDITIPIAQNTVTIIPGTTTKTSTIKNKNACKVTAIAFPNPLPLNQDKVTIDAIGLVHTSKSRCQVELNEVGGWRSYDLPVTFIWPLALIIILIGCLVLEPVLFHRDIVMMIAFLTLLSLEVLLQNQLCLLQILLLLNL